MSETICGLLYPVPAYILQPGPDFIEPRRVRDPDGREHHVLGILRDGAQGTIGIVVNSTWERLSSSGPLVVIEQLPTPRSTVTEHRSARPPHSRLSRSPSTP